MIITTIMRIKIIIATAIKLKLNRQLFKKMENCNKTFRRFQPILTLKFATFLQTMANYLLRKTLSPKITLLHSQILPIHLRFSITKKVVTMAREAMINPALPLHRMQLKK